MSRSIVRYDSVGPSKNSENLSSKEDQRKLGKKSLTDRWIDKEASHLKDYLSVSKETHISCSNKLTRYQRRLLKAL